MKEQIKAFDKDLLSYGGGMQQVAGWIFEFGVILFIMIPYQVVEKEPVIFLCAGLMLTQPAMFYIRPYLTVTEGGITCSVAEKIKYTSIPIEEVRSVRVEYLAAFVLKTLAAELLIQIFITMLAYHKITLGNILYVILAAGVWPFLVNLAIIYGSMRKK